MAAFLLTVLKIVWEIWANIHKIETVRELWPHLWKLPSPVIVLLIFNCLLSFRIPFTNGRVTNKAISHLQITNHPPHYRSKNQISRNETRERIDKTAAAAICVSRLCQNIHPRREITTQTVPRPSKKINIGCLGWNATTHLLERKHHKCWRKRKDGNGSKYVQFRSNIPMRYFDCGSSKNGSLTISCSLQNITWTRNNRTINWCLTLTM